MVTSNKTLFELNELEHWGTIEVLEAIKLLQAYCENRIPNDFSQEKLSVMFNSHSSCVFLTNEDLDVCMINPVTDVVEFWNTCSYCCTEGFPGDNPLVDGLCKTCITEGRNED